MVCDDIPLLHQAKGSVCSAAVTVIGDLNHEDTDREYIMVRVTDPGGHFAVKQFNIIIVDVNDAPKVREIKEEIFRTLL